MSTPPRLHPFVCAAVLAIALALLLHDSLFGGKGLVSTDGIYRVLPWSKTAAISQENTFSDQYGVFVPSRQFFHDEIVQGRFPLWNPHASSGVPSLASMQGAALYPVNLFLSWISPFAASGFAALIKLFVAGLFTFLYVRRLGATNAAALVAGLTFSLSGFLIVWLGHPHTNVAVLLPVLFYFVEGAVSQPRAIRSWIGVAVAFGVMWLGGHPPTAVHVTMALLAYAAFRAFSIRSPGRWLFAGSLLAALTGGLLIAAPQLFPFAEYYQLSSSSQSSTALARWASHLRPGALVHFLLPYLSGSPHVGFEQLPQVLGIGSFNNFNEHTGYVGVLALFLASIAVFRRRCAFSFFFAALAIVGVAGITGVPPWRAFVRAMPVLNSINHERLMLWVDWSGAVLAGLGADTLLRAKPAERSRGLAIAFGAAVLAVLFGLWSVGRFDQLDDASRRFLANQLWVPAGGLLAIWLITRRWLRVEWVAALCILCTGADLLYFAIGYNPTVPRERYYPATDAIRFLQSDKSVFRLMGWSNILMPNTAGVFGLDDIRGQDFMSVARYEQLITGDSGNFFFYEEAKEIPAAAALLNLKYLVLPEVAPAAPDGFELVHTSEVAIYRSTRVSDRASIVLDYQVDPNPAAILGHVRDSQFDPGRTLWLEEQPVPPLAIGASAGAAPTGARITHYEPDHVTVEATLPRAGFLLLRDTYFPGWAATVDGRPAPIYRADYAFRAVPVPAGVHTVTFDYRPASFRWGLIASTASMGFLLLLGLFDRRAARHATTLPPFTRL